MLDTPVDAWYAWVGTALVAVAALGVATGLPTAPLPDADAAADTVDGVAAVSHEATARHPLSADAVRLTATGISLRSDGGTATAEFAFGPVTPVSEGSLLWEVLRGAVPSHVFDSPAEFRDAAERARARPATWRPAGESLRARTTTWGEVRVTLVFA